jgi:FkbM family methyltransferase
MTNNFYSQFEQDRIINTLLNNKKNGFFVDIGAYDGITFSNSFFFEKHNNWSGICFEPNPISFKKLSQVRNCILINGGISDKEGSLTFKAFSGNQELEMLSGFQEFFNEIQKLRIEEELINVKNSQTETVQIQTHSLNKVLKDNNVNCVDYCSIDTEGGEYNILKTIDFDSIYISTLSVEDNFDSKEVIKHLDSKGFNFLFLWKCDLFFINKNEKISFFTKIKLVKYYLNYHLKNTGILYIVFKRFYKSVLKKS